MKKPKKTYFWLGFTSILDLYPESACRTQRYWVNGVAQDWKAVGNDFRYALSSYDEQRRGKTGRRAKQSTGHHSACTT